MPTVRIDDLDAREHHRIATRGAIATSAIELLRLHGVGRFTVDDIAARAGVSRRTFFNYFPSREAALMVTVDDVLDRAVTVFVARPSDEPLIRSMREALIALADPIHLAAMAEVFGVASTDPQVMRFQLQAWEGCADQLVDAIERRPGPRHDSLYVASLVGSVLSSARAALTEWHRRTGGSVAPDSLDLLNRLLLDVIGFIHDGFSR